LNNLKKIGERFENKNKIRNESEDEDAFSFMSVKVQVFLAVAMHKLGMEKEGREMIRKAEKNISPKQGEFNYAQVPLAIGKAHLGLVKETEKIINTLFKTFSWSEDGLGPELVVKGIIDAAVTLKRQDWLDRAWRLTSKADISWTMDSPSLA